MSRLQGIQSSSSYPFSHFLQQLDSKFRDDFNDLVKLEEDYWKFSRVLWINDGDANINFFHIMASNRNRRNNIIYFKDNSDNWIDNGINYWSHFQVLL